MNVEPIISIQALQKTYASGPSSYERPITTDVAWTPEGWRQVEQILRQSPF